MRAPVLDTNTPGARSGPVRISVAYVNVPAPGLWRMGTTDRLGPRASAHDQSVDSDTFVKPMIHNYIESSLRLHSPESMDLC